jgi:hypothetical protein
MFEERKKWTSLVACRAWKLKAMGRNRDKGKRSLCLGEETHITGLSRNYK